MNKHTVIVNIVAIVHLTSIATASEAVIYSPVNRLNHSEETEAVVNSLAMFEKDTEYVVETFVFASDFQNKRWIGAAFLKSYEINSDVELIGLLFYEDVKASKYPPARLLLNRDRLLVKAPGMATKKLQLGSIIFANRKGETRVVETDLRFKCQRDELREASNQFFDRLLQEVFSDKSDKTSD